MQLTTVMQRALLFWGQEVGMGARHARERRRLKDSMLWWKCGGGGDGERAMCDAVSCWVMCKVYLTRSFLRHFVPVSFFFFKTDFKIIDVMYTEKKLYFIFNLKISIDIH